MHQALPPQSAAAAAAAVPDDQPAAEHDLPLLLDSVRVVLVSPKTPANIGAVLRVAENFEASSVHAAGFQTGPLLHRGGDEGGSASGIAWPAVNTDRHPSSVAAGRPCPRGSL